MAEGLLVARLEQHHPLPCPDRERLVVVELLPGLLVEGGEVAHGKLGGSLLLAEVEEVLDQHPERGAPVADVVLADHVVAEEGEDPDEGVADDRGPEVAHVHLLGHVRRRVVDDHPLGPLVGCDAEPRVAQQLGEPRREPGGGEAEVEEARPRDLGCLDAGCRDVEGPSQDLCDLPGGPTAEPLGERHGPVGLVVAEAEVGSGPHDRVGVRRLREGRGDGGPESGVEGCGGVGHPQGIPAPDPGAPGTIFLQVPPS